MSLDIANANVNRNITLAGTSIAIFTFCSSSSILAMSPAKSMKYSFSLPSR